MPGVYCAVYGFFKPELSFFNLPGDVERSHGACSRRCGQPCSRAPCDEPCPRMQNCGHPCRGLCGETCPGICKQCRPDTFPTGFIGEEYEDDEKFIQLEDCKHVLEVKILDTLMMGDPSMVQLKSCPYCRKPIINTPRYKDVVNKILKTEINPIKRRIFGNAKEIALKNGQLQIQMTTFSGKIKNDAIRRTFAKLQKSVKSGYKTKKKPLPTIEMQLIFVNFLNLINKHWETYSSHNLTALREEITDVIKCLCNALSIHINKMSEQVQKDVSNELKRLNSIIQFSQILERTSDISLKLYPKVKNAESEAKKYVFTWSIFEEKNAIEALEKLQKAVSISGIVTKEERDLVIKAIGSKAGSWYKCPNGHVYSIDACGGAMQTGRCADCGAAIGGNDHRLLGDNRHAGEIDNSTRPAWPISQ